ncbi:MAG: hypothetical protein JW915_23100 [Chitinispirillaceae bacterium]|nr:hypothetical protein [Chitinispirillaceae bacterium]
MTKGMLIKKTIQMVCLWLALGNTIIFGQWGTSGDDIYNTNSGSVGIGTSSPQDKLHVSGGDFRLDADREIFFNDNGQIRSMDNNHRILFRRSENKMELREYGDIILSSGATSGNETGYMVLKASGSIGVGTSSPSEKLEVDGTVKCDTVKCDAVKINGWTLNAPDYVFEKEYNLRSLKEVENHISAKKHLPDVPSASEIRKNGLDLTEMNMILLKKVEELTLYAIEQNKKIEKQQKQINELKQYLAQ